MGEWIWVKLYEAHKEKYTGRDPGQYKTTHDKDSDNFIVSIDDFADVGYKGIIISVTGKMGTKYHRLGKAWVRS